MKNDEIKALADQCQANARFYSDYAGQFEIGSLGWISNMAEAEKRSMP